MKADTTSTIEAAALRVMRGILDPTGTVSYVQPERAGMYMRLAQEQRQELGGDYAATYDRVTEAKALGQWAAGLAAKLGGEVDLGRHLIREGQHTLFRAANRRRMAQDNGAAPDRREAGADQR